MGRMKDLDLRLNDLESHLALVDEKLDQLLHLMQDMVKLEGKIDHRFDNLEAAVGGADRLIDRLIEMSMVKAGQSTEAVTHRAQSRLENTGFASAEAWEPEPEPQWPPDDCSVMDLRG